MQGAWVPSLVGKLRSHMPCDAAKKKKKEGAVYEGVDTEYKGLHTSTIYSSQDMEAN